MNKKYILVAIIIVLTCNVGAVLAESMRCGNGLVRPGDSTEKLLKLCGEPTNKEMKPGRHDYWAEYWTYRKSSHRFGTVLKIEDNKITSIERAE